MIFGSRKIPGIRRGKQTGYGKLPFFVRSHVGRDFIGGKGIKSGMLYPETEGSHRSVVSSAAKV